MLAEFRSRTECITCLSPALSVVAAGSYDDAPLHDFLAGDPWGESPLPALHGATWSLVECRACGTRFHGRVLTPEWRAHCFEHWMNAAAMAEYERRHGSLGFAARFDKAGYWIGHVLSIEAMTRGGRGDGLRILDFGCGSGDFLAQARCFGADVYGIDASPDRRMWADRAGAVIEASLDRLPADLKGRMDAVTLFEVLEHLDAPREILLALAEWVRPGGLLILETPDAGHVSGIATAEDYHLVHPIDHINAFSPATLTRIAKEAGFAPARRRLGFTSSSLAQSVRKEARRLLTWAGAPSTQQYFRKIS